MTNEGYFGHADYQFLRSENHFILPEDLETFARIADEVVVVLSVEEQVINIYVACAVERPV